MRLIVVALLGIEITILALASAASAATHPEGSPAQSGLYEAEPGSWGGALARSAVAAVIADAYEAGPPNLAASWAHERLMRAHERLEEMRDWPAAELRWPLAAVQRARAVRERTPHVRENEQAASRPTEIARAAVEQAAEARADRAQQSRSRETATAAQEGPVRLGVIRMPQARPHVAHRRAQVDLTRALPRAAVRMSHATANGWLKSAGLRTQSTGNCVSKHMHHCTSLDKVRTGTVAKAIELKRKSGCPIMVTGGTERGHAPGQFSHGNGYKLDISHNACIDRHIAKHSDKAGVRSDGARIYKSSSGTTFFDESDHWDILFR
ncbi:hypothetical protein AB0I81_08630 [Nonomuraea sp. NPDC050404]|uniref:hypothetical protein n=1 Tax=Nonomuraea sp. NPDC050404 TaxID=3155783 RepID=UPI0033C311FE